MGSELSCMKSSKIITYDTVVEQTFTDGEKTEFLAYQNNFLFGDSQEKNIGLSPLKSLTPSPLIKNSKKTIQTRIFSSNFSEKSVNIIEKINQSTSASSSNMTSQNTSRCVSPFQKKGSFE